MNSSFARKEHPLVVCEESKTQLAIKCSPRVL